MSTKTKTKTTTTKTNTPPKTTSTTKKTLVPKISKLKEIKGNQDELMTLREANALFDKQGHILVFNLSDEKSISGEIFKDNTIAFTGNSKRSNTYISCKLDNMGEVKWPEFNAELQIVPYKAGCAKQADGTNYETTSAAIRFKKLTEENLEGIELLKNKNGEFKQDLAEKLLSNNHELVTFLDNILTDMNKVLEEEIYPKTPSELRFRVNKSVSANKKTNDWEEINRKPKLFPLRKDEDKDDNPLDNPVYKLKLPGNQKSELLATKYVNGTSREQPYIFDYDLSLKDKKAGGNGKVPIKLIKDNVEFTLNIDNIGEVISSWSIVKMTIKVSGLLFHSMGISYNVSVSEVSVKKSKNRPKERQSDVDKYGELESDEDAENADGETNYKTYKDEDDTTAGTHSYEAPDEEQLASEGENENTKNSDED